MRGHSKSACAAISVPNVSSQPGIGRSFDGSAVICRKTPESGPPLWACPVECRNRGPNPSGVATRRAYEHLEITYPENTQQPRLL